MTAEFYLFSPAAALWHAYDPKAKTEVYSTAVAASGGVVLVDPISLPQPDIGPLLTKHPPVAVVVTNANHWRAAGQVAGQLGVPVFAHPASVERCLDIPFTAIEPGSDLAGSLEVIAIEGAVAGEIALRSIQTDGTMIVGDALIHFDPYGFTLLPPKYCLDQKVMARSLRQLLEFDVKRIFFAHGPPILSKAQARLRDLLGSD